MKSNQFTPSIYRGRLPKVIIYRQTTGAKQKKAQISGNALTNWTAPVDEQRARLELAGTFSTGEGKSRGA
jgi:hypothetical protein